MKIYNFPFTAILGQDGMKSALILNLIDPKIGGVLLTGQQGTGKTTAVRSLIDLLPEIEINDGCQFQCDPLDTTNLCDYCKSQSHPRVTKPIELVNLPLGATEDMVIGSLDIEKIIRKGKREIQAGLLAKAHRGILYIDEINLLQDHLVDILLDVSASGVNLIEREGISITHPARFILVGSMNPEEGELRPQISDRLGLEIPIVAPTDPTLRAEITRRVIEFNDSPASFCKKYAPQQTQLKKAILQAKNLLADVKIPLKVYQIASELVLKLKLLSQRADITFIRCARAHAAFRGVKEVAKIDLEKALLLVFEHRIKRYNENVDSQFLGHTFDEIYGKIKEAIEDPKLYDTSNDETMKTFKFSPDIKDKYKENPLNKENRDIPEVEEGRKASKDRHSTFHTDDESIGYKVGDLEKTIRRIFDPAPLAYNPFEGNILKMNITPIMEFLKTRMRISNYVGRGSRVRVLTRNMGRYIYARKPRHIPKNIAFDATIKHHFLNHWQIVSNSPGELLSSTSDMKSESIAENRERLTVPLYFEDLYEKMFEVKAPLTLYFIVDASASMVKTLNQIIKVIQSVHAEGYKKKDKISVISFQGRDSQILQRPSVSFSVGLIKLRQLETTSYTPLASALHKTLTMITQERIKGTNIPVILILSDLGANVSEKYPELNAQIHADFAIIEHELDEIAQEIGKKGIKVVIMKPLRGSAMKFLGVYPHSVDAIQQSFLHHSNARLFEFDVYDPKNAIIQLKRILS